MFLIAIIDYKWNVYTFTHVLLLQIYIGGVANFDQDGINVKTNFDGCLENVVFNSLAMIKHAQAGNAGYLSVGQVPMGCTVCAFLIFVSVTNVDVTYRDYSVTLVRQELHSVCHT